MCTSYVCVSAHTHLCKSKLCFEKYFHLENTERKPEFSGELASKQQSIFSDHVRGDKQFRDMKNQYLHVSVLFLTVSKHCIFINREKVYVLEVYGCE